VDTLLDFVDEVSLCIRSKFSEAVFYFTRQKQLEELLDQFLGLTLAA
jgi:hypothetical protein